MSHLGLIVLAAIITFASRISFMIRPLQDTRVKESRFLEVFPTALFVALAITGFAAPDGNLDLSPAAAAGIGGVAGAVIFRRSVLGVAAMGLLAYWVARWIWGT
jgi:branched-subunit amino acid transport protein